MDNKTAPIPSGVYVHPVSIVVSNTSPQSDPSSPAGPSLSSTNTGFVDHYAIMGLDNWVTSEEVKKAYRQLRAEYFRTDPAKYRALQEAYVVLADKDARWHYDVVYRKMRGLPAPPPLKNASNSVRAQVTAIEAARPVQSVDAPKPQEVVRRVCTPPPARTRDKNFALKMHKVGGKASFGKQPYVSFVPILKEYKSNERHPKWKCSRPKYILTTAYNAMPY